MPFVAKRSLTAISRPVVVNNLDDKMENLGFTITDDGLGFIRTSVDKKTGSKIKVLVKSGAENTVENVYLEVETKAPEFLPRAFAVADKFGSRFAQLGYPGGSGGLWNVNQDEGLGGPRWWLYDQMYPDMRDLELWIKDQFRYHPPMMMSPDMMPDEIHWDPVATVKGETQAARLVRDRQEVILEVKNEDGSTKRIKIRGYDTQDERDPGNSGERNELSQEIDKYQVGIAHTGTGKSVIFVRKLDERGDNKGIWEINGGPASGIAHIEEDGTSYSLHPEVLDDRQWTQGIGPGVVGYIPKY